MQESSPLSRFPADLIEWFQEAWTIYSSNHPGSGGHARDRWLDFFDITRDLVATQSKGVILDIGCGDGLFWDFIRPKIPALANEWTLIGVDGESVLVERETSPFTRGVVLDLDRDSLPLEPDSADLIFLSCVLEHLRDPLACVQDATRVLRPGGRLVICYPSSTYWGNLRKLLRGQTPSMFTTIEKGGRPHWHTHLWNFSGEFQREILDLTPTIELIRTRGCLKESVFVPLPPGQLQEGRAFIEAISKATNQPTPALFDSLWWQYTILECKKRAI